MPGPLTESTRVEAFSDGVFAIAITLLVLDLRAPTSRDAFRHDLLEDEAHTAFFAAERRRAVFGITLYALSALVAAWSPITGLVLACILPVFYGITSNGWRSSGSAHPSAPVGGP